MNDDPTTREAIHSSGAPAAVGPYSQALLVGRQLFSSGQIGLDPDSGELVGEEFADQARQVFKNLAAVLTQAGMSFADVVRVSVFLTDIDDFAELNEIYAEYFAPPYPARVTLEASALPKDAQLEIALEAVAPS